MVNQKIKVKLTPKNMVQKEGGYNVTIVSHAEKKRASLTVPCGTHSRLDGCPFPPAVPACTKTTRWWKLSSSRTAHLFQALRLCPVTLEIKWWDKVNTRGLCINVLNAPFIDNYHLKIQNLLMPQIDSIISQNSRPTVEVTRPTKNKNFFRSVKNAWKGIMVGVEESSHVRFHLVAGLGVILAAMYFRVSFIEWAVLLVLIGSIITAELFNSAIEDICTLLRDRAGVPYEFTGKSKDIGAGAVLVLATLSVFIAILIFGPRILNLLDLL